MDKVTITAETENGSVRVALSDKPELMLEEEYEQKLFDCVVGAICAVARKLSGRAEDSEAVVHGMIEEARQKILPENDSNV